MPPTSTNQAALTCGLVFFIITTKLKIMDKVSIIEKKCTFIASQEDDRQHYVEKLNLASFTGGEFFQIEDYGDCIITENNLYYIVNDCGIQTLYLKPNKL